MRRQTEGTITIAEDRRCIECTIYLLIVVIACLQLSNVEKEIFAVVGNEVTLGSDSVACLLKHRSWRLHSCSIIETPF